MPLLLTTQSILKEPDHKPRPGIAGGKRESALLRDARLFSRRDLRFSTLLHVRPLQQNAKIYKKIRCLQNSGGPENVYTI